MKNRVFVVTVLSLMMILATAVNASAQNYLVYNAVENGDFELGDNGSWKKESSQGYGNIICRTSEACHANGNYAVWLGGAPNETYTEIRSNKIFLSYFNPMVPELTFQYDISAYPSSCTGGHINWLAIHVNELDQNGNYVASNLLDAIPACDTNNTYGFVSAGKYNLSSYRGRWIEISISYFSEWANSGYSNVYVDDVAIEQAITWP